MTKIKNNMAKSKDSLTKPRDNMARSEDTILAKYGKS